MLTYEAFKHANLSLSLSFFWLIWLFRVTPAADGGFQVSGLIGATAGGLHHSSQQHRILNPLSKTRDQTHNLMVPIRIRFRCVMMGTS